MNKGAAISRADLLRALVAAGAEGTVPAGLLGYERRPYPEVKAPTLTEVPVDGESLSTPKPSDPPIQSGTFPNRQFGDRSLRFLVPVELSSIEDDSPPPKCVVVPMSDRELAMPRPSFGMVVPLVPWSRLAPFLRRRLGVRLPSHRIDLEQLCRLVTRGRPWRQLPRVSRQLWGHSALVLWDTSPEMEPYLPDVEEALRRLKRERGRCGLRIRQCYGPPVDLPAVPSQVPVLVFSAMGQLQSDPSSCEVWAGLGRSLSRAGHRITALSPVPRRLRDSEVVSIWPTAIWDQRSRPLRALPASRLDEVGPVVANASRPSESAEMLLTLLSTAALITPGLLRQVRLLLGPHADAGTEHEAWFHADGTGAESIRYFSLRPGPSHEARLEEFSRLAQNSSTRALVRQASELIVAHHKRICSSFITMQAEIRGLLSGSMDPKFLPEIFEFLERVVERLRALADTPGSEAGRSSGLAVAFDQWVNLQLPPAMRADPMVSQLVAQGLALSRKFLQCVDLPWPTGLDTQAALAELRRHGLRGKPVIAHTYHLVLKGDDLLIQSEAPLIATGVSNLGSLIVSEPLVHALETSGPESAGQSPSTWTTIDLCTSSESMRAILTVRGQMEFMIQSDRERLRFAGVERPYWASRMWYDPAGLAANVEMMGELYLLRWKLPGGPVTSAGAGPLRKPAVVRGSWVPHSKPPWARRLWVDDFGVAADFEVASTSFVLRWIPAGRFLMGSPDDEEGRWDDEGPQHEVVLTRGFWMGETPVTRAQWRAVLEATGTKPLKWMLGLGKGRSLALQLDPSHFKGSPDLPVESVDWKDCIQFTGLLDRLFGGKLRFDLPSEAQWEFACRAGTQGAFQDGSRCTEPGGEDVGLNPLGWYGRNSDGKTHPVKQKRANDWGLFDLHGNVWEWCRDGQRSYSGAQQRDPVGATEDSIKPNRVVRGGSWGLSARECRAAYRDRGDTGARIRNLGFRLVADQELSPPESEGEGRLSGPERVSRG